MTYMLSRNRVLDFDRWKAVFAADAEAHRAAGLHFEKLWRNVEDPHEIFFLFAVESVEKAKEFISAPEAAEKGEEAGAVEGEVYFVEEVEGY